MIKKSIVGVVLKRGFLCALVLVLVIILPMVNRNTNNNIDLIYKTFVGKKSEYQGFIEVWNIDTFEGGTYGKTDFLNKIADEFQRENKGTYVIVRNISETECKNMLARGQKPDIFSCSYGVASELKDYVSPYSIEYKDIYDNLLNAGNIDGLQYAVPWCFGNYYLISTRNRVQKQIESFEKINLSTIAFDTGYEIKHKNSVEVISSLGFGYSGYLLPQIAFKTYTGKGIVSDENSINKERCSTNTSYGSYCDFIAEKFNILLGTQRDVYRVVNREQAGKISDVIIECVEGFTDLIQFAFIADNGCMKLKYAQLFVEKLVSDKVQSRIAEMGMFSVKKTVEIKLKNDTMSNIIPENISNYKCEKVFVTKSEIQNLQVVS